jgi:small subunit ribosomal protein S20
MANTRKSTKRAGQALKRQDRNQIIRGATKTALHEAVTAIKSKDAAKAKAAYLGAIRALSKAGSKGSIPRGRAARKISRLTLLAKKALPEIVAPAKK